MPKKKRAPPAGILQQFAKNAQTKRKIHNSYNTDRQRAECLNFMCMCVSIFV